MADLEGSLWASLAVGRFEAQLSCCLLLVTFLLVAKFEVLLVAFVEVLLVAFIEVLLVAFVEVLLVAFVEVLLVAFVEVLVMCLVCWCASVGAKSKVATIKYKSYGCSEE